MFFTFFKIVQMVLNRAKHHIFIIVCEGVIINPFMKRIFSVETRNERKGRGFHSKWMISKIEYRLNINNSGLFLKQSLGSWERCSTLNTSDFEIFLTKAGNLTEWYRSKHLTKLFCYSVYMWSIQLWSQLRGQFSPLVPLWIVKGFQLRYSLNVTGKQKGYGGYEVHFYKCLMLS